MRFVKIFFKNKYKYITIGNYRLNLGECYRNLLLFMYVSLI